MKRLLKIFGYTLLIVFFLLQFYPRPKKNSNSAVNSTDITRMHVVPANVQQILKRSCYDCHSNNTDYPWYASIQPVAMWLGDHIEKGKNELNFSEFSNYSLRRQYRKLEEIDEEISEDHMPLPSYTFIHTDSKLSESDKITIRQWVTSLRVKYTETYPADSLARKK